MKLASKSLCLVLSAAVFVLTGCPKKPDRPTPLQTAPMGPSGLAPTNVDTTLDPNSGLTQRTDDFDPNGVSRSLLAANTVYFDFDQFAIKASEREKLKAAKDYLDKNP